MPKLLTWHDEWSLNIETLDQDHRDLIARLGDICLRFCPESGYALVAKGEALIDALSQFGEAVRAHFKREEAFMRSFDYEFVGEHEGEHALLMAEFTALLTDWRREGLQVFDESHQAIIRDWLLAHILGADRHFAETYFRLFGLPVAAKQLQEMRLYQSSYRARRA